MTFRDQSENLSGARPVKNVARTTRNIQKVEGDDESSKKPFVIVINGAENASSNSTSSVRARIINQHTSTNNAPSRSAASVSLGIPLFQSLSQSPIVQKGRSFYRAVLQTMSNSREHLSLRNHFSEFLRRSIRTDRAFQG